MLTKRLRKQIEWHFYNYAADKALYDERVNEVIDEGLTAKYDVVGGRGSDVGNPTERKGLLILASAPFGAHGISGLKQHIFGRKGLNCCKKYRYCQRLTVNNRKYVL